MSHTSTQTNAQRPPVAQTGAVQGAAASPPELRLPATSTIAVVAAAVVLLLVALGIAASVVDSQAIELPEQEHFVRLFHLSEEANVPTILSVLGFGVCALLAAAISAVRGAGGHGYVLHWRLLALLMVAAAIDEGVGIHESFNAIFEDAAFATGYLTWTWVIFGFAVVLALALFYLRFMLHLPRRTAGGIALSGILYLAGALVFETFSANIAYEPTIRPVHEIYPLIEETLELAGIALFLVVLWSFLVSLPWRTSGRGAAVA